MIHYEWTLETLEDGDIIDSTFSDSLTFDKEDIREKDLGLVRNVGNNDDGLIDRWWAYVKDGKLPQFFEDAYRQPTHYKIPAKFHKELAKYLSK